MIGWKIDIYRVTYTLNQELADIPKGDLILLDSNQYFVIGTIYNDSYYPGYPVWKSAQETASLMEMCFGNDQYNFYGFKSFNVNIEEVLESSNIQRIAKTIIPSLFLIYPGTNSYIQPSDTAYNTNCIVIVFKTTGKFLLGLQDGRSFVGTVESDTLVFDKRIYGIGNLFSTTYTDNRANLICKGGALSNQSSWYFMYLNNYFSTTTFSFEVRSVSDSVFRGIQYLFSDKPDIIGNIPPTNPYEPQPPSGTGDLPPGTFDDTSDPIPDSPLPTLSAANTGFTRIYNPTLSQVQALARYLWTDESVVQTIWNKIKQYFEDPMQAILGFNLVPVPVPDGGQEEFALMYIPTGVTMTVAANQFVDVDCGTLVLDRYYGSALDQSPYTKIHAFLPFIGTVRLNTDEVMGTTLSVKYRVDIVSGSCVAKIFVDGNCLYQYSGHCAITIPISSADFSTYVSAAINVAKSLAPAVSAEVGAAMAPMSVPDIMIGAGVSGGLMPSHGAPLADYYPSIGPSSPISAPPGTPDYILGNMTPKDIANTVSQVNSGKPYIQHSGAFSGNSGYLGIRRPFLIIERPNMCLPENYQALNGFPSMITLKLGDCSGYTRIQQVQLTGMTATNVEQSEIMGLLKGGVVL